MTSFVQIWGISQVCETPNRRYASYQEVKPMNALRPLFDALLLMTFMIAAGTGLAILLR